MRSLTIDFNQKTDIDWQGFFENNRNRYQEIPRYIDNNDPASSYISGLLSEVLIRFCQFWYYFISPPNYLFGDCTWLIFQNDKSTKPSILSSI